MAEGLSRTSVPDQADGGQGFKAVFEQLIDNVEAFVRGSPVNTVT